MDRGGDSVFQQYPGGQRAAEASRRFPHYSRGRFFQCSLDVCIAKFPQRMFGSDSTADDETTIPTLLFS